MIALYISALQPLDEVCDQSISDHEMATEMDLA